jgi:hypothetical protein
MWILSRVQYPTEEQKKYLMKVKDDIMPNKFGLAGAVTSCLACTCIGIAIGLPMVYYSVEVNLSVTTTVGVGVANYVVTQSTDRTEASEAKAVLSDDIDCVGNGQDECDEYVASAKASFTFFFFGQLAQFVAMVCFVIGSTGAMKIPSLNIITTAIGAVALICYIIATSTAIGGFKPWADKVDEANGEGVDMNLGVSGFFFIISVCCTIGSLPCAFMMKDETTPLPDAAATPAATTDTELAGQVPAK